MLKPAFVAAALLCVTHMGAQAQEEDVRALVKKGCSQDYMRFCSTVMPVGDGMNALECLLKNRKVVSRKCQDALIAAREARSGTSSPGKATKNWSAR